MTVDEIREQSDGHRAIAKLNLCRVLGLDDQDYSGIVESIVENIVSATVLEVAALQQLAAEEIKEELEDGQSPTTV